MNSTDLAFTSAVELAKLVRQRVVSPLELTKLYLDRIDRANGRLGAFFTVTSDRALTLATAQTETLAQTEDTRHLPPFFGVPISVKDLTPVEGIPCTRGAAVLRDRIPNSTAAVVAKLEGAGFNILGKTATSELGSMPFTEPPGFPPARNPWNLDYTPGGSSGGAAAAVAAGLCPVAHGSDGGGSVRGPAACCGLVGLKPSRGRISQAPAGEHLMGMATAGPLTRTVADAAAMLDVMSGYVTGDPYWLPQPKTSFLEAMQQSPPPLRAAVATEIPGWAIERQCRQAVEETATQLEASGHRVELACPDFRPLVEPFRQLFAAGVASTGMPPEVLSPVNRWLISQVGTVVDVLQAQAKLQMLARSIVAFFEEFDLLILPTYLHPTVRVGEWAQLPPEDVLDAVTNWILPCPPFNASGQPSIAVPSGFDDRGLPLSVQVVGKPGAEATLLQVAAQLERSQQWCQFRPPQTVL
ncbi:amidase [Baaleninema simplex]|uniref:amidase n=1 Tax=Baaleninema simplex TaxID=2862350 RepID=UPI000349E0BD|nr:amidase [Baaleninema simplex]